MRLLLVNSLYPPRCYGGAERSVALLAEALARDGVEVHVATLAAGSPVPPSVEQGVTVHRLPIDQSYWPWGGPRPGPLARLRWHLRDRRNRPAARRFGALLDRVRPDLVHGHVLTGFGPAIWAEATARAIPLAQTLRDYALICPRSALFRGGRLCKARCTECRLMTARTRAGSKRIDAVAANSDFTLAAHRDAGRFEGVPGTRLFNIVPGPSSIARRVTQGPLTFGFLGRVEPEKGIEILLAALPRIGRAEWRLVIGGSGRDDYVRHLRRQNDDRRIVWSGQVDAATFYASIDVVVVPSLWPEPLPRTAVEAVAHGRSLIAARSGGIPEVIALAATSALYRADDPDALADVMRGAIDDPGPWRAGGAASAGALDPFSEASVVAAHHHFYAGAMAAARA